VAMDYFFTELGVTAQEFVADPEQILGTLAW
jgi:hypothetical protein